MKHSGIVGSLRLSRGAVPREMVRKTVSYAPHLCTKPPFFVFGGIKKRQREAAVWRRCERRLIFGVELTKSGFCGVEFCGREVVKANGRVMAVLADRGVREVDVAGTVATVATVNVGDFRRTPGFGDDAADAHGVFGGDGIDLATHADPFPKRCKEGGDTEGTEGDKEGAHAEFNPDGERVHGGLRAIDGDWIIRFGEPEAV